MQESTMSRGAIRMPLTQRGSLPTKPSAATYTVTKLVNVTTPRVGSVITEDEVKDYIDHGREITITVEEKK